MRRTCGAIFNTLAVLSLLLSLATAAMWVRSYWWMTGGTFGTRHTDDVAWIDRGRFWFQCQPVVSDSGRFLYAGIWVNEPVDPSDAQMEPTYRFAGLYYGHFFTSMAHEAWWVSIPCWWLVGLFMLLPATWVLRPARRG